MFLKPVFSQLFDGHIWKIYPDSKDSLLILEIRNYENRVVSFAAVDINKQQILWDNLTLKETWWTGIEAVNSGKIIFHGYNHVQYSNHIGMICYDARKQKFLWEEQALVFYRSAGEKIYAQNKNDSFSSVYMELDFKTGEKIRDAEAIEIPEIETNIFPVFYSEIDSNFSRILLFIYKIAKVKAEKAVEYLEYNNHIFISYYLMGEDNKLTNQLLVFNGKAEIVFETILDSNLDGVGIQTFFVYQNQLIFVKYKKTLEIYTID